MENTIRMFVVNSGLITHWTRSLPANSWKWVNANSGKDKIVQ